MLYIYLLLLRLTFIIFLHSNDIFSLVFQPAVVLHEIANCMEGAVQQPIQYQLKSSKAHGSGTDYIKALVKTADSKVRSNNMTIHDLDYARHHLDRRLMTTFHYHVPEQ
jgi:hypothetical protein